MAAIDYLKLHHLNAEVEEGNRLAVWPADNITPEVRAWIRAHKAELLQELSTASSKRRRSWKVIRGGKPIATLCGRLMTPEQALEAARARWSDASIEE